MANRGDGGEGTASENGSMKLSLIAGAVASVGAMAGLILLTDPSKIWDTIVTAGWWIGVLAVAHMAYVLMVTFAWRSLLVADDIRRPFGEIFRHRWIADGLNALTPFLAADGEVVRGYLQAQETEVEGPESAAVIIVELTARMLSLAVFIAIGIVLFAVTGNGRVWLMVGGGGAMLLLFLGGYYYGQKHGALEKLANRIWKHTESDRWKEFAGDAEEADERLKAVYSNHGAFARSAAWHFAAWVFGGGEMVLILRVLGHPVGPVEAWVFEAVGQTARNAGFFLPAALGAQEGGYLLGARAIGLASAVGVGVSIIKRIRDILFGLPAIGWWQVREVRKKRERAAAQD